jgi:hypothetical protein
MSTAAVSGSRTACCEVDYALGGGDSGGETGDGGVKTRSAVTEEGTPSGACIDSSVDASASAAQGVIVRQSSGAGEGSQGAWWCDGSPVGRSAVTPGISTSGMSMPAMSPGIPILTVATLDDCSTAGMAHAKPLPAHNRCAKRRFARSAESRRVRRMGPSNISPEGLQCSAASD